MSVDPIPSSPQEPAAPTPDSAAPSAPAAPLPESPLGPEFAAAKQAAFEAVQREAAGGAVPDADTGGGDGTAGSTPAAPADASAPDAGDERPLSRSERYEYKQLQAEVERLKSGSQQQPAGQPQTAPAQSQPTQDETLAEVRREAGLDAVEGGADYQTLSRLTQSRDYDALARLKRADGQSGGYTLEEALVELQQMGRVQKALASTAGYFERRAIAQIGSDLDAAAAALGLDPAAAVAAAQKATGSPVAAYLKQLVDAAEKRGAAEWQGRYEAEAAAHRGTRAGRIAGRSTVETGGGSAAASQGLLQRALSGSADRNDFIERAKRGEFVGLDLSDN